MTQRIGGFLRLTGVSLARERAAERVLIIGY
jgi:hypothetical protein